MRIQLYSNLDNSQHLIRKRLNAPSSPSAKPNTSFTNTLLGTLTLSQIQKSSTLLAAIRESTDVSLRNQLRNLLAHNHSMFDLDFPPENFTAVTRDMVKRGNEDISSDEVLQEYSNRIKKKTTTTTTTTSSTNTSKILYDCALGTAPMSSVVQVQHLVPSTALFSSSSSSSSASSFSNQHQQQNQQQRQQATQHSAAASNSTNASKNRSYGYGISSAPPNSQRHANTGQRPSSNSNDGGRNDGTTSRGRGNGNGRDVRGNSSNNNYNINNSSSSNNYNNNYNNSSNFSNSSNNEKKLGGFKSAGIRKKNNNNNSNNSNNSNFNNQPQQGAGLKRKFKPPRMQGSNNSSSNNNNNNQNNGSNGGNARRQRTKKGGWDRGGVSGAVHAAHGGGGGEDDEEIPEQYKGIDPKLIESIENDIVGANINVKWEDIAGLEFAKRTCQEIVVLPIISPHLFSGLRRLPKGLLLFGPPGTGKTLIGKAIASQTGATFFSISASSLTSKWIGQGEKMVRALFAVASYRQPSVIFIDEIDSLLTQRTSDENEASRRIKTEFLVQLDGAGSKDNDKILVLGATNRPQELDEAARRRFMKRLYIPLPNATARESLLRHLLKQNSNTLKDQDIAEIVIKTKGYSGSDLDGLCREAAMAPLREKTTQCMQEGGGSMAGLQSLRAEDLRPIRYQDLSAAMRQVRASVSQNDLAGYIEWDKTFGSFSNNVDDEEDGGEEDGGEEDGGEEVVEEEEEKK